MVNIFGLHWGSDEVKKLVMMGLCGYGAVSIGRQALELTKEGLTDKPTAEKPESETSDDELELGSMIEEKFRALSSEEQYQELKKNLGAQGLSDLWNEIQKVHGAELQRTIPVNTSHLGDDHMDAREFKGKVNIKTLNDLTEEQTKGLYNTYKFLTPKIWNKEGDKKHKIYLFCLTGGPCAGKSSCLQFMSEKFSRDFKVFVIPEMATMTINAGKVILPDKFTPRTHTNFTKGIMKMQMDIEEHFINLARLESRDCIIFSDRGMLDNLAYCTKEVAKKVMAETGWDPEELANHRYDAVYHLVTAADGAESFYTLKNNNARSEPPEIAKMLDGWIINAWIRHNNHYVIDNSSVGFQAKMDRLYNVVALNVGTPGAKQFMKKYLLEGDFTEASIPKNANVSYVAFSEKFDYLIAEGHDELRWLKEKTDSDGSKSWCSVKRYLSLEHEERREVKKKVSEDMYLDYLKSCDPARDAIHKKFIYFVTRNQPYMIETFEHEGKTVNLLKIETDVQDHTTQVPDWIKIGKDVTEDPKYFNHNIALKH